MAASVCTRACVQWFPVHHPVTQSCYYCCFFEQETLLTLLFAGGANVQLFLSCLAVFGVIVELWVLQPLSVRPGQSSYMLL